MGSGGIKLIWVGAVTALYLYGMRARSGSGTGPFRGVRIARGRGLLMWKRRLGDPSRLNPLLASDSASGSVNSYVFNGLVKYDRDLKLVGELAESWDVRRNGLEIVFHLRRNVTWHDGVLFHRRRCGVYLRAVGGSQGVDALRV
jgi:hypothetical protein